MGEENTVQVYNCSSGHVHLRIVTDGEEKNDVAISPADAYRIALSILSSFVPFDNDTAGTA